MRSSVLTDRDPSETYDRAAWLAGSIVADRRFDDLHPAASGPDRAGPMASDDTHDEDEQRPGDVAANAHVVHA